MCQDSWLTGDPWGLALGATLYGCVSRFGFPNRECDAGGGIRVSAAGTVREEEGPRAGMITTGKGAQGVGRGGAELTRFRGDVGDRGALRRGSAGIAGGGCCGEMEQGKDYSSLRSLEPSV